MTKRKKKVSTYREGVPPAEGIGNGHDPNARWRAYHTETNAFLGVVVRDAPSMVAARTRAALLYNESEEHIRIERDLP